MTAIFGRELKAYFTGITGYLFAAFLLLFAGIYTMAYNLSGSYANFEYALDSITFIYLIGVPILTMRTLAEERRQHTDQLLYSLPVRLSDVVIGKYLALLCVLAAPMLVMCLYPLILSQFGAVYLPTAYLSIFGFFLLGAALLSIGVFVSAVTENQVTSAVICLVLMLLLFFITGLSGFLSSTAYASFVCLCVASTVFAGVFYLFARNLPAAAGLLAALIAGLSVWYGADAAAFTNLVPTALDSLSLFDRFSGFVDGVFDLTAVVFDLSVIGVFLFLSTQALEKRRWSE